jgi:hypothetical protein
MTWTISSQSPLLDNGKVPMALDIVQVETISKIILKSHKALATSPFNKIKLLLTPAGRSAILALTSIDIVSLVATQSLDGRISKAGRPEDSCIRAENLGRKIFREILSIPS